MNWVEVYRKHKDTGRKFRRAGGPWFISTRHQGRGLGVDIRGEDGTIYVFSPDDFEMDDWELEPLVATITNKQFFAAYEAGLRATLAKNLPTIRGGWSYDEHGSIMDTMARELGLKE
jgi:hypothetical protein